MYLQFTVQIFRETKQYVSYTPELDVSSCGRTANKALTNLKEAVRLFLEAAREHGTLSQILDEAGYSRRDDTLKGPPLISTRQVTLPVSRAYAEA